VCGEAASLLQPSDPRREDLARIGCDDGEPDACFLLGKMTEQKDPNGAKALYDVACPAVIADDGREEIYSKAACDALSTLYEEGRAVAKDSDRGYYYSRLACTRSGFALDHAPCVRKALYHARNYRGGTTDWLLTTAQLARKVLNGDDGPPVFAKECERPSVAELCKTHEKTILTASTY
jgi:TPR repeat protein